MAILLSDRGIRGEARLTSRSYRLRHPPVKRTGPDRRPFPRFLPAGKRFGDNSLDMGTGFDCFHDRAHTANKDVGAHQRANRLLLKSLMEKHGFVNYELEWWHFTLKKEPFPDTYFDFPIE